MLNFSSEYWKQKCKADYLFLGDSNTPYYQAQASIRRNRNQIKELYLLNGEIISNTNGIAQEITRAFYDCFSADCTSSFDKDHDFSLLDSVISDKNNAFLISVVSGEEVKSGVFDLAPDKSSCPDGFPPFFFQKYWSLVGNSVTIAVQVFFHSGRMLKEINHTFLALIPNIDNPSSPNHFLPICLYSSIYRVISKILTNRLKDVLGQIIHQLQGAFLPDRLI